MTIKEVFLIYIYTLQQRVKYIYLNLSVGFQNLVLVSYEITALLLDQPIVEVASTIINSLLVNIHIMLFSERKKKVSY